MKRREFLRAAGLGVLALGGGDLFGAGRFESRPNLLFLFPDQHRFDWTSMNPALPEITPNLKALAQGGVHFTNALTPSPVCAPARACLASGKEYAACRVSSNGVPYPLDQTTFYTLLKAAGYHVLGCGKFDLDKPGQSWGPDGQHRREGQLSLVQAWGFTAGIDNEGKQDGLGHYAKNKDKPGPYFRFLEQRNLVDAYLKNVKIRDHDYDGPPVLADDAYCDNWIARNALDLIRSVPKGEPWFIQINFDGPHPPMDVTKSMYEKWKGAEFPGPWGGGAGAGKNKGDSSRRNYAAMIDNIDAWLGRFREELKQRGELDRTIIVYCSDHGEMLGDRGLSGKSKPWQPSAAVPLVMAGPGIRMGVTCKQPVETLDLTATFLDYAGVPRPNDMDSLSLRPYLEGKGDLPRKHVTSALGNWRLVFDGRYKLIAGEAGSGKEGYLLYDLQEDPHENTDLSGKQPDIVKRLVPLLPPEREGEKGGRKNKRSAS
jgi:arylsulfatase A-like enzyme